MTVQANSFALTDRQGSKKSSLSRILTAIGIRNDNQTIQPDMSGVSRHLIRDIGMERYQQYKQ
ncbi:MAG: hypothetical protein ACI86X_001301 [Moritella sp.]|jgi:hypothetical protein